MFPQTILAALLFVPAGAKTVWTPSDINTRRLTYVTSTTDTNAQDCVVGGYDPTPHPLGGYVVRVGGPCNQLDANLQPTASFRWVSMLTVYCDVTDANGVPGLMGLVPGSGMLQTQDLASHAEVGTLGHYYFVTGTPAARVFASQTSYLAQSTFEFNTVDFVVGGNQAQGTYDKATICTEACCASPPCTCSACPETKTTATQGEFKYSIFAASFDDPTWGNLGWESMAKAAGGTLTGSFNVYQYIDFTTMQADNMTLAAASSSVTYSAMTPCAYASLLLGQCTWTSFASITLAADGWDGLEFAFPTTYNSGDWSNKPDGKSLSNPVTNTNTVQISAIKPDQAWINTLDPTGSTTKLILVRYTFDATGVTATNDGLSGKWMAYDPSVRRAGARAAAAASSNSNSAQGTTSDSVSRGCFVAVSMAAWCMLSKL